MYLTCPTCHTVYAVRAAMLREGQGEVRCGACRSVFNALDCLSDELPRAAEPPAAVPSTAPPAHDAGAMPAAADPAHAAAPAAHEDPPQRDSPPAPPAAGAAPVPLAIADAQRVPAALREDLEAPAAPASAALRNTGAWAAAVLLLALLAVQYLWFAPADLAGRFPIARAAVERFCVQAGCMQRAQRAPEQIRMISRDVRAHPRYEGALLISATFTNAAAWPQPFPRLRFSLYDVTGTTIAARTFAPRDYLAGVLPADASLPPGQPVQIGLEVLAPEQAAVSFEFEFL